MILGEKTQVCHRNMTEVCHRNTTRYSTDFGGEGFGKGERSLGLGGALDAVAQGAHALLAVARETSPLDLPHRRVAEVGHVCPDSSDSFANAMDQVRIHCTAWGGPTAAKCQMQLGAGAHSSQESSKWAQGPSARYSFACSHSENHKTPKGITVFKNRVKNRFWKPKTEFQAKRRWGTLYLKGQKSHKYGSHLVCSYLIMASSFALLTSCSARTYHPDFEPKKPVSVDYELQYVISSISAYFIGITNTFPYSYLQCTGTFWV